MKRFYILFMLLLFFISSLYSQDNKIAWQRSGQEEQNVNLFHSTHVYNLSTTEMIQKKDLQFIISHRFIPPIDGGSKELYGLDGPANILFSLGYALSNDFLLALSRTNSADNYLLNGKWQFAQWNNPFLPIHFAFEGGVAWNSDPIGRSADHNMNFQYYSQILLNTLISNKLGIGVVPSYLYNSHIYCNEKEYSFTIGSYIQYYISSMVNVGVEYNTTVSGFRNKYDSFTFGVELETGGHFFKIILSNNANISSTQYLAGADLPIHLKSLRLGFNITRLF